MARSISHCCSTVDRVWNVQQRHLYPIGNQHVVRLLTLRVTESVLSGVTGCRRLIYPDKMNYFVVHIFLAYQQCIQTVNLELSWCTFSGFSKYFCVILCLRDIENMIKSDFGKQRFCWLTPSLTCWYVRMTTCKKWTSLKITKQTFHQKTIGIDPPSYMLLKHAPLCKLNMLWGRFFSYPRPKQSADGCKRIENYFAHGDGEWLRTAETFFRMFRFQSAKSHINGLNDMAGCATHLVHSVTMVLLHIPLTSLVDGGSLPPSACLMSIMLCSNLEFQKHWFPATFFRVPFCRCSRESVQSATPHPCK